MLTLKVILLYIQELKMIHSGVQVYRFIIGLLNTSIDDCLPVTNTNVAYFFFFRFQYTDYLFFC